MEEIIHIETISQMSEVMNQDKPLHPMVCVVDFSKMDFTEATNIKITTGFYSIMVKNLCPGSFKYGRNYYDFQEGSIFFLGPNQVTSLEDPQETQDVYGWGLFFHPELVRGTSLASKMKEYTYFSYDISEALHVSDAEMNMLGEIIQNIQRELEVNIDKHSKTVIVSMIELLLNYCNRYYDRQFITRTESNKDIIAEFESLLTSYFGVGDVQSKGLPSVSYCAERLHKSPNYLSDLLKKETGKNATEHIQYHVIELAKDRLLSSNDSVSEIAYSLGFEYPQYFNKMFKKNVGMTPSVYRKQ